MSTNDYQSTLNVAQLLAELKRLLSLQRQADRLICRYLADLADRVAMRPLFELWHGGLEHFVLSTLGLSPRATRERIRVGRALRTLPALDAALVTGEIVYSRIREVTRVAKPHTELEWLKAARQLSVRALERRVSEVNGRTRPRPSRARQQTRESTDVNVRVPRHVWALVVQAMRVVRSEPGSALSDAQALAAVARAAIAHHQPASADRPFASSNHSADPELSVRHSGSPIQPEAKAPLTHSGSPIQPETTAPLTHGGSPTPDLEEEWSDPTGDTGSRQAAARESVLAANDEQRCADSEPVNSKEANQEEPNGVTPTHSGSPVDRPHEGAEPAEAARAAGRPATRSGPKSLTADSQRLFELICGGGLWHVGTLEQASKMPYERFVSALFDLELSRLVTRDLLGFYDVRLERAG